MKQPFSVLELSWCIGALILPTAARAQQAFQLQGLTWTISQGDNIVDFENEVVHITQGKLASTSHYAVMTANTGLANAKNWKITFDYRVGIKRPAGSSLQLFAHGKRVLIAGADSIGVPALLVGEKKLIELERNDQAWHHVELNCGDEEVTTTFDGKDIGRSQGIHAPDMIEVGTRNSATSQQTELWVRNIVVSSSGELASSNSDMSSSISDTFANGPLAGLWDIKLNGATIDKHGSELQFLPPKAGDSFGIMTSRDGALPIGSSWKVTARFRYPARGPYGVGFGIEDSKNKDHRPFWSHYDENLKLPRLLLGSHEYVLQNPGAWHDLTVVNSKGRWTVWLDAHQILAGEFDSADYKIYFGADISNIKPWGWTTLAVQSVQIDYTDGPQPMWLADVLKTQPHLSSQLLKSPPVKPSADNLPANPRKISSLGLALGVDSRIPAPASPAPDGHLIVTARNTMVDVQRGSIIEFRPQLNRPDYTPDKLHLLVNHFVVATKDVFFGRTNASLPTFIVDAPTAGSRSTLVSIVAEDVNRRQVELCNATLTLSATDVPNSFVLKDEQVRLTATKDQTPKAVYAFLESEYLGCLKVNLEAFAVDARHLPVGQHRFWLITESSDGALHPPIDSTITILPRFKLSSFAQEGTFTVDRDNQSIPVHVHREVGTGVNKSYLYVAGAFIGESDRADFDMSVFVTEVSSGNVAIEAVGVGKDGSLYPPESIHVNLKNVYTDSAAASSRKYKDLQGAIAQIGAIDQEIEYWYTRACNEPDFVTFTSGKEIAFYDGFYRMASVAYINSITVPGKVGDYLGRCKAAIIKRAQIRLDIGRRYKELGRAGAAKSSFQQAIQEAGENSGIGAAAVQELQGL